MGRRAERSPHALALISGQERVSYSELARRARRAASELSLRGVSPGERVALLVRGGIPFAAFAHGVSWLGAVLVPLNLKLTRRELLEQLRDSEPKIVVADQEFWELGQSLCQETGLSLMDGTDPALLRDGGELDPVPHFLSDPLAIIYTSGTTGTPKGAVLTRQNFLRSAESSMIGLGLSRDDRWLICMPLYHVGGLSILWRAALYGNCVVLHGQFSVDAVIEAIAEDGVTITSFVPLMLERMMDRVQGPPPGRLRAILLGGAPAPDELLSRACDLGYPIFPTYGLTETASQAATLPAEEVREHLGSAGKPLFYSEIRIFSDDGRPAPAGSPGEIGVRGPTVSPGYWRRDDATAGARRDGWFLTGDIGRLDGAGYLYVLDRRDDLIVSGGENVYPAEIEAALRRHPAVLDAGVCRLDDPRFGQAPAAAVVLRPGTAADEEELLRFAHTQLAGYKVPKSIVFVRELPRNAGGKLLRRALRQTVEGMRQ